MLLIGSIPVHFKQLLGNYYDESRYGISEKQIEEDSVKELLKYKEPWIKRQK